MNIKHQYVVDDQNRKVAVQLDLNTFGKMKRFWKIMHSSI
jgi:hypothetical protein